MLNQVHECGAPIKSNISSTSEVGESFMNSRICFSLRILSKQIMCLRDKRGSTFMCVLTQNHAPCNIGVAGSLFGVFSNGARVMEGRPVSFQVCLHKDLAKRDLNQVNLES